MTSFNHGVYFTTVNMLIVEPTLHHNCNRILFILDVLLKNMFDNFIQIYFTTYKIEQFFSFAAFQTSWYPITVNDQMILTFLLAFSFFLWCHVETFSFFLSKIDNDSVKISTLQVNITYMCEAWLVRLVIVEVYYFDNCVYTHKGFVVLV